MIKFDEEGVCNYCKIYKKQVFLGVEELIKKLGSTKNKILYGLSGGVDGSYGLHFLIKELGYKKYSYIYIRLGFNYRCIKKKYFIDVFKTWS